MPLFIIVNLCIGFLLQNKTPIHNFLVSDISLAIACTLLLINLLASGFKFNFIPYKYRYDFFATGAVLAWYAYWPPYFVYGSPMFDYFPVYFAFITVLFSLVFITKRENIDPDALNFLQWLSDSGRFHPVFIMISVIIGLAMPKHFLLFPASITILIMRYALARCLDNE